MFIKAKSCLEIRHWRGAAPRVLQNAYNGGFPLFSLTSTFTAAVIGEERRGEEGKPKISRNLDQFREGGGENDRQAERQRQNKCHLPTSLRSLSVTLEISSRPRFPQRSGGRGDICTALVITVSRPLREPGANLQTHFRGLFHYMGKAHT